MTSREIRDHAAYILEASEDAWCQGVDRKLLSDKRYAYCLVGACREAAGYYATHKAAGYYATRTYYAAVANAAAYAAVANPATWNDAPDRTREEVIAALRAC